MRSPSLKKRLFETGQMEIIEASRDDNFWGVTPDGRGENMMGKIIMQVRDELRRRMMATPIKS